MKLIIVVIVMAASVWLWHASKNQVESEDQNASLFNPDSPDTVPHLYLPASNSGVQNQQIAWRDYLVGTNAYRAQFTYHKDRYLADQMNSKSPRRYMATVEVFSVSQGSTEPVLTKVGHEFNGFYEETQIGYWAALEDIYESKDAIKVMLKNAQETWPIESQNKPGN